MTEKMTRKDALEIAIAAVEEIHGAEFEGLDVLRKMYAQVTRPRKKAEGPSKARRENEKLAADMAEAIAAHGEPVTSKWICEHVRYVTTPQKATAVAKVGAELGLIVRSKEGKAVYYSVPE